MREHVSAEQSVVSVICRATHFTDLKETCQLQVKGIKCTMKAQQDGFESYTTRIETSYELWMDISMGKVNGAQAMMERKYRTLGILM